MRETDQTEKKRFYGEAEATIEEKEAVGGEKTLQIDNHLFQTDADAQDKADDLLDRLKSPKDYFEIDTEFCPVPVEPGDTIGTQEFITDDNLVEHLGLIRQIKLSVTPSNQTLTMVLEYTDTYILSPDIIIVEEI